MFDELEADVLVNTVNCVGTMGKGVALEFSKRYPDMVPEYKRLCKIGAIYPGGLFGWTAPDGKIIANFATKNHWRDDSKYIWIIKILHQLCDLTSVAEILKGKTVVMPALGCGNGNLNWEFVKTLIIEYLKDTPANFIVYEPM